MTTANPPKPHRHHKRQIIMVGCLKLGFIIWLAWQLITQQQQLIEGQRWVAHTQEVDSEASKLLLAAIDGSNAMRGYLISGQNEFLPPYWQMLDSLPRHYERIKVLTQDNPRQQARMPELKELLQKRIDESGIQFKLYQNQGVEAGLARVASGDGLYINNQLRQLIGDLQQEEQRLLIERQSHLDQTYKKSLWLNIIAIGLFLILSSVVLWSLLMDWRQRNRHEDERELLNAELDTRNNNLQIANESLQQADRLKNEFMSAMSHELRTPLNSIIGFTGLLRMGIPGPLNEEQHKQLTMVDDSAKHLLHLINDLLDLSRIEAGRAALQLEHFDFKAVAQEAFATVEPMAREKGLTLKQDFDDGEITLYSDRRKVYQILLNLINNAVKFSQHGVIEVTCRRRQHDFQITVRDQGIGISSEQLPLLFQAFRQVDGSARRIYEGTGLGLYLSKKLLAMLGGDIHVESDFGRGSWFIFTLPLPTDQEVA